jgi:hypothetical protein
VTFAAAAVMQVCDGVQQGASVWLATSSRWVWIQRRQHCGQLRHCPALTAAAGNVAWEQLSAADAGPLAVKG